MGKDTLIEWCDSTVNCTTGCDGCELWKLLESRGVMLRVMGGPCYAGNYHETRMAKALPNLYAPRFTEVRLAPGRMAKAAAWSDLRGVARPNKPWLDHLPRVIFVGDLGDIFSAAVPFDYLKDEVIDVANSAKGRRHVWMLLTKQPRRMAEFATWLTASGSRWPDNVWAGTSVTTARTLSRVGWLKSVPAQVRFLSVEPQLEFIDVSPLIDDGISLVIQGGESDQKGHRGRPFELRWVRVMRDQCKTAGVAYLLKQIGSDAWEDAADGNLGVLRFSPGCGPDGMTRYRTIDSHGGDPSEWPSDIRVRQMPAPAGAVVPA